MPEKTGNNKGKRGLMLLAKMLLAAAINIAGVFVIAKVFPLPQGQGLAYVAHPFFALVFGLLAAAAYFIGAWVRPLFEKRAFLLAIAASWLVSLLIFVSS